MKKINNKRKKITRSRKLKIIFLINDIFLNIAIFNYLCIYYRINLKKCQ